MAKNGWYRTGKMPEEDPITEKQLWFVRKHSADVLDVLEPRERCAVDLMGYEEWSAGLTKREASEIIGVLKGEAVAREVSRRTEVGARAVALSVDRRPKRKWYDTQFGGARNDKEADQGR